MDKVVRHSPGAANYDENKVNGCVENKKLKYAKNCEN